MNNKLSKNAQSLQTSVGSSYFDRLGSEIKLDDILFYSEYDGKNNEYYYADGIYLVIELNGQLACRCKVMTMTNAKHFIDYDEPINNVLMLHEYCDGNKSKEFTKIGNLKDNTDRMTSEFANKTYCSL